ncbi:MAG: hypothetical protein HOW73_29350 [Polyangiaceae bacterium]|nr:hypothetical protein [Polyangiaceae bacterium]
MAIRIALGRGEANTLAEAVAARECALVLGALEPGRVAALAACSSRLAALVGALLRGR